MEVAQSIHRKVSVSADARPLSTVHGPYRNSGTVSVQVKHGDECFGLRDLADVADGSILVHRDLLQTFPTGLRQSGRSRVQRLAAYVHAIW